MDRAIVELNEEYIKKVSLGLFAEIKPTCVELSQLTLNDNEDNETRIMYLLGQLNKKLDEYYLANKSNDLPYILLKNLGDYILFPLSNLLKKSKLKDSILINILNTMDYLVNYCWKYTQELNLIDQIFSLVLFLSGKDDFISKSFVFKVTIVNCLRTLIDLIPTDYFNDKSNKMRMSFLGDSITILLNCLTIPSCNSDEDIQFISKSLLTLTIIFNRISADDLSQVLPGTVSRLVNFSSIVPLIHYTIIIQMIQLLQLLLSKVFNDEDLKINCETIPELLDLQQYSNKWISLLDENNNDDENPIDFQRKNTGNDAINDHLERYLTTKLIDFDLNNPTRSKSWLTATSNQLKISLIIFFKNLMINHKNRIKLQTKSKIGDSIIIFVRKICTSCFLSLFQEFVPLAIDVLALYISIIDENDTEKIMELSTIFTTSFDNSNLFVYKQKMMLKLITMKLQDLIENRFPVVLNSSNDDKINTGLVSIKFQMKILKDLSEILQADNSDLKLMQVNLFKSLHECLEASLNKPLKTSKVTRKSVIDSDSNNKLDGIELPLYIDANLVTKTLFHQKPLAGQASFNSSLINLSKQLQEISILNEKLPLYFTNTYSSFIENKLLEIISFISTKINKENDSDRLMILETILGEGSLNLTSTGMWIANNYLKSLDSFKINDYLNFDDVEGDSITESSYLVLARSLQLIDKVHDEIQETQNFGKDQQSLEFAYAVALDAIGTVCTNLSFEDFRADFMIDYLLPLLEALTLNSNPKIQIHSINSIREIINNYYQGSFEKLIVDNLDYLIDSINLRLASSDLTHTLPGILLVIFRFAGIQLLKSNQLTDIMNQVFITIDTYHGYSKMVEGYFIVFDELTKQILAEYKELSIEDNPTNPFRPWGMKNIDELCTLLQDNQKMDNVETYDGEKEYFKDEEESGDSDDEEDMILDQDPNPPTSDEVWTSIIPENTYNLVLTIFNYGFKLLSQPETSLKVQILRTLMATYPILCSNYKIISVQMTKNYPILITLISGTISLSTTQVDPIETENLIAPALEFAIKIINEDDKSDRKNFSRQFIDTWSFLSGHSPIFTKHNKRIHTKNGTQLVKQKESLIKLSNPNLGKLYSRYILIGINCYNKAIPDLTKIEMVRFCVQQGLPDDIEYCQEIKNILWVLRFHLI